LERSNNKFISLYRECLSEKQGKVWKEFKGEKSPLSAGTCATTEKIYLKRPKTGLKIQ
jgi:hypothetical protein